MKKSKKRGLIIAANRLPVSIGKDETGGFRAGSSSGGLVTAMQPVLRDRGGLWVGWPGISQVGLDEIGDLLKEAGKEAGYRLKPVFLTEAERQDFYHGFSNEIIWPLFHDLQSLCNFEPDYWAAYETVNRRYAQVLKENAREEDFIWVHDYHLMNAGAELRELGFAGPAAFFLHIPFPPLDVFVRLPWRTQLLKALMAYDLIGFQTLRDQHNFIQCVQSLVSGVNTEDERLIYLEGTDRTVKVGAFPIGIDFGHFARAAATKEVSERTRELLDWLPRRQLILGVDRLDYTKGIPQRLEAFAYALEKYPDLQERITLVQVVVPSREDIPSYGKLKMEIERLVGEINGRFTKPCGWVPIHYVFRSLDFAELVAFYRAAQIALITPLKDGMNLVAKEYCACSLEEESVLILSEFAGAAAQLQEDALLVNPHDREGVADAIWQAYAMGKEERKARMARLRRNIEQENVFGWVEGFLKGAVAADLEAFCEPKEQCYTHD